MKTRKCCGGHYRKMIGEKEGDGTVEDISGITKEELDRIAKKIVLYENDRVELSSNDWVEENRIRYLKRHIKVHYSPWDHYTLDCTSITSEHYDPEFLYIFAFSTTEESTKALKKLYSGNALKQKGYYYKLGFSREELSAVDYVKGYFRLDKR